MAEREPYRAKSCRHFCGSGMPCHAGVDIATVRDADERVPCISVRGVTGSIHCNQMEMPPDPPAQAPGSMLRNLIALTDGRCPTCDQPIRGEVSLDGKILAMPCRHVLRSEKKD